MCLFLPQLSITKVLLLGICARLTFDHFGVWNDGQGVLTGFYMSGHRTKRPVSRYSAFTCEKCRVSRMFLRAIWLRELRTTPERTFLLSVKRLLWPPSRSVHSTKSPCFALHPENLAGKKIGDRKIISTGLEKLFCTQLSFFCVDITSKLGKTTKKHSFYN